MSDPNRFDPGSVGTFRVVDRTFDRESRTVSLGYALDDDQAFVETVTFETPSPRRPHVDAPGLDRALLHLHIAAGTSYYKTAAPPVVVGGGRASLTAGEIAFHQHLYDQGLREFAVANGLPVPRPVAIRRGAGPDRCPRPVRSKRADAGWWSPSEAERTRWC